MALRQAYGDGFAGRRNIAQPSALYVKGDENTDGSLRMLPVERENGQFDMKIQERTDGVWNDTGVQVAAASIHLGKDLLVSGGGRHIHTFDLATGSNALLPHMIFDAAGTASQPHTPILGPLVMRSLGNPDDSSQVVGTDLSLVALPEFDAVFDKVYFKTGSIAPTKPIFITFQHGSTVFYEEELPLSLVGFANTEFVIEVVGQLSSVANVDIIAKLVSDATFSLKSSAGGEIFFLVDFRLLGKENILTDSLILSNDLRIAFSNTGRLSRPNQKF